MKFTTLVTKIAIWQAETFGKQDVNSKIRHLQEEVNELLEALEDGNPILIRKEFADCFMLIIGAAVKYGYSPHDMKELIYHKLEINKKRTWGEPDEKGVVHHVKQEDEE